MEGGDERAKNQSNQIQNKTKLVGRSPLIGTKKFKNTFTEVCWLVLGKAFLVCFTENCLVERKGKEKNIIISFFIFFQVELRKRVIVG